MLDLAGFRLIYPEFRSQSDALVQKALDMAEARTDAGVFGTLTDEAHGALTADILTSRPAGQSAKMKDQPTKTVYANKRLELEALCAGFRGGAI